MSGCQVLKGSPLPDDEEEKKATRIIRRVDISFLAAVGPDGEADVIGAEFRYVFEGSNAADNNEQTFQLMDGQELALSRMLIGNWLQLIEKHGGYKAVGDTVAEIYMSGEPLTLQDAKDFVSKMTPPAEPSLDFDIDVLLDKDLVSDDSVPSWYKDGPWYVKDEFARKCEPVQRRPFLYTGKKPAVDQKLQIQVSLPNGDWGRLSGLVTKVHPEPTDQDLESSGSLFYSKVRKNRQEVIDHYGAAHGQMIEGCVSLNFDFHGNEHKSLQDFFKGPKTRWMVILRCNDHMGCMWEVVRFQTAPREAQSDERFT